jgi:tetratricopeptide (TPR) repeat protein
MVPPSQSLKPGAEDSKIAKSPSDISTYPKRYIALLGQAISSFHVRDFRGAIATLDKADEIMPATPWSLNTRGAIDIEQKNWAEGARNCMDALRIDPNFYPAKFNLCEIPFYQGKYAEARAMWERLLSQQPKDELLMYRIFFTYLLEGDIINTDAWLKRIPFPSETPAYQYAHLAFFMYQQKEAEKINDRNRAKQAAEKVEEWTKSAEFIWPEQKRANFIDVFIQLGWMKRTDLATQ